MSDSASRSRKSPASPANPPAVPPRSSTGTSFAPSWKKAPRRWTRSSPAPRDQPGQTLAHPCERVLSVSLHRLCRSMPTRFGVSEHVRQRCLEYRSASSAWRFIGGLARVHELREPLRVVAGRLLLDLLIARGTGLRISSG